MDHRGLSMYQHPRMTMMGQPHISSVPPGSIPINVPMSDSNQGQHMGIPADLTSGNGDTYHHETHPDELPVQQHYSQLPLRKEVDDEGRICGVVLPETPAAQHPTEENNVELEESSHPVIIKTEEEEDIANFMEDAYDTFLKISSKELTIKGAAEMLGRPYSFVYTRYQEFCDKVTGKIDEPEKKKKKKKGKKRGKKRKRGQRLTAPRDGTVYQCEECPGIFYTEYMIKTHNKLHEPGAVAHKCTACGIFFPKLLNLMRHRIEFHEEALQCPHCDIQFPEVGSYRLHVKSHTPQDKPFCCNECGKGFYSRYNLACHVRKHTGERPYMCGYCEKTFTTLGNLKIHQYVHTGGRAKNLECLECGKKYQFKSALEEHMNVHRNSRPYACNLCDARFNFKQNLMRHNMTHTGEQPHKCQLCPAAFTLSTDLKRHMTAHTGLKPFKCDMCDYSCTRKSNMEFHKYTHTGETPFKCDFYGCTAEYSRPNSLKKHKLQHGPPPPQTCKVCLEKFPDTLSLKRHMMIHTGEKPQTCDQCFKTCIDKAALKRHMYKHMYKPPGHKTKQVRQPRKNPVVKKPVTAVVPLQKKWPTEYQTPVNAVIAENGHSVHNVHSGHSGHGSIAHTWTINAEDTSSQPTFHPFTASQYTNLVSNAWPTTMDPDELRRRLLSSFK